MPAETPTGRRFISDIRRTVRAGKLRKRFRAADVRRACLGWSERTYSNFLPKHRVGNPGGNTERFVQPCRRVGDVGSRSTFQEARFGMARYANSGRRAGASRMPRGEGGIWLGCRRIAAS